MSWRETAAIIIRARREGVTLSARADGKLGWKANPPPSDELLTILKEHKADILALLPPPASPPSPSFAVGPAKAIAARLWARSFRPRLDGQGALLITDTTGKNRGFSWIVPTAEAFDVLNAGLDADLDPLDRANAGRDTTAKPDDLSDLDLQPEPFEPEAPDLIGDDAQLFDEDSGPLDPL